MNWLVAGLLALACASVSPTVAARRHPACVAVMIEMVPARICPPARRR